ncbi:protein kinase [Oscillochloris sp. ZM17-4]|uniref:protein kinase domain-containing protein n=1 Tax=Oscillochloris sp. ZM17-4 TaxID=2866714 RepID=UPI001C734C79|nr:protein kinase [Oscillochloris sp. ZM17-4]
MPTAHEGHTTRLALPGQPDSGVGEGDLLGGRFRLGRAVGWGGQAVVFEAGDTRRGGAAVAVKVARRDLPADERAEAEQVLRWEGGLLRRLRHPALPRLHGAAAGPAGAWIARDLVPGTPLLALARQAPQDPRQVLAWAAQLCDLLTFLHTRPAPVVCGDIKPANLILRPDGGLALIDLGATTTLTRRPPRKPRPRHGTPGYAPPEQLAARSYDERSDVFSLAVTCYELLTGLDPALAPLQFDLARLDRAAPRLRGQPAPARQPGPAGAGRHPAEELAGLGAAHTPDDPEQRAEPAALGAGDPGPAGRRAAGDLRRPPAAACRRGAGGRRAHRA